MAGGQVDSWMECKNGLVSGVIISDILHVALRVLSHLFRYISRHSFAQ